MIPANNPTIWRALSPYHWVCGKESISTAVTGASIQLQFKATRHVALRVDTTNVTTPSPTRFPIIAWTVNGGALETRQLAAKQKSVLLAPDVADPQIDFYVRGMSPFEDRFTGDVPPNAVKITGFDADDGATVTADTQGDKIWLNIGDSIMAGDGAGWAEGQGRPPDDEWAASDRARASYGYLLARHFRFREARLAYGGYSWTGGAGNLPALSALIDQKTSTISRLTDDMLRPAPGLVLINLGENGVPDDADVVGALEKLRRRAGPETMIVLMIPVSGRGRDELMRAFATYQKSARDDRATLIDLGLIHFATADGQHPTAAGHQTIYENALPIFHRIVRRIL